MKPTSSLAFKTAQELFAAAGTTKTGPCKPELANLPALRTYPTKLFAEITTRCNLQCQMCVKQTGGSGVCDGDMSDAVFAALEEALPQAESLVLNGIGEPLLHPGLDGYIRRAKQAMPAGSWVGFQSNGLLLTTERARSLAEAGLDRICLSMDGIDPETFRRVREGGELTDMERAFAALRDAKATSGRNDLQVGVEFVVMRDNIHELPEVLRYATGQGADFAIVTHLLPYAENFVDQIAYDLNSDQAVEFFAQWQQKAADEGVDINGYFRKIWRKVMRFPEDRQVNSFMERLKADASSRDVFISLEQLMNRDETRIQRVEQIFAEAEQVARETGLRLTLPATVPAGKRSCAFAEGGSVFISWDGKVHPCYFLWHRFDCHFPDRKKIVKPKVFGDLIANGLLEIWNDQPFRTFRKAVLRDDYPSCANCALLPCEYIYAEDFEQDCFANQVPCGDCFWCTGLFNCLQ